MTEYEYYLEYLKAFQNMPPESYTEIEEIDFVGKPKMLPQLSNNLRKPIHIIPDVQPGEIFLPIVHSILTPNILKRYFISNYGRIYDSLKQRFLSQFLSGDGYYSVAITCKKDQYTLFSKLIKVHQLVCFFFNYFPGCYPTYEVNHIDSNKSHNISNNVEWVDKHTNGKHRSKEGIYKEKLAGENKKLAKLKDEDVHKICKLIKSGARTCDIMKLGYSKSQVQKIKYKTRWTDISSLYDLPDSTPKTKRDLTDEQAENICKLFSEGKSILEINKITGIETNKISSVKYDGIFPEIRAKYGI